MDVGAQWTNTRAMIRAAYNGSWFHNLDDTLTWDNPLQLTDTTSAPGHGRTALWPSNSLQTLSTAGYVKLAHRTQLTGSLAFGWWNNNEDLLPFTVNSALTQMTLPRSTAEAAAHTVATNVDLVSRPLDNWRLSARFRRYDYTNETPETAIPKFINYDTSVATSATGGPELFAHNRNTLDTEATWTGLGVVALTVGYTNNHNGYDFRIFESSNENVLQLKADAAGLQWVTFRAHYEYGSRTGSGLDEELLVEIGEQPQLRHYDLANRTRNRFDGQVDLTPTEALTLSVSAGFGKDDFGDSYFGLQEAAFRNVSLSADYLLPRGLGVGGTYNYERYSGLQRSRSASPGQQPPQETDPNRDWTADSKERVNYFSIYAHPPRIGEHRGAHLVRLRVLARQLRLCRRAGAADAVAVATGVQQAAGLPAGHPASRERSAGRNAVLCVRAVSDFRLRVRPQRDQQYRAAELAGSRLHVPAVHGAHGGVRHSVPTGEFHWRQEEARCRD